MKFTAEFFDIFGLGVFAFITAISIWALKTGNAVPRWALVILLGIGIAGLLVDGVIVYKTYVKQKR